ncbi:hypothetical protein BGM26_13340 [Bacillus sp. FJAT-29790]|uniref:hypothetical protein n=1 Tax=Bacillus sp. FJAT-29790 TaxID=1895002 RepID=UPI001C24506E|nr:hypothetical protein [Bacillus sp. FJAT-29790]MBU8879963.1 hypothetical protein [Bacillus sp. FJAT-29790]
MSNTLFSLKEQLNQVEEFLKGLGHEASINSDEDKQKPEIVFAISLKSKKVSRDWERVQNNLSKTLRSIFNNTDQKFRIIIAGHKKPCIEELNDERVTWLSVKFPPPLNSVGFTSDKYRKRKVIGAYLRKHGFSGYFMPLDADDWIHYRFVEYIRSLPVSDAFILNKGCMVNVFQREAWVRDGFFTGCGSSALFYFSSEKLPDTSIEKDLQTELFKWRHHGKVLQYLRKINKSYTMVDYPLVTWVLAHGDNNSMIKKKMNNQISAERFNTVGEKLEEWFCEYFRILDK